MTAFALSTNPTTPFNPTTDAFLIDTTSAGGGTITQEGADVVIRDSLGHTARLQGMLIQQFSFPFNITTADGSLVLIGDNSVFLTDFGNNTLTGTGLGDYIAGFEGNDTINDGGGGSDRIYGNEGNDSITGSGAGTDSVYGGQGNDNIDYSTATGASLIYGNLGNDFIQFGSGGGTIFGGQGDDSIQPGTNTIANLRIDAGLGNDFVVGGNGPDTILGGGGNDIIYGDNNVAGGADVIYGNQGNDVIKQGVTTSGSDTVFGGQDDDRIDYSPSLAGSNNLIYGNLGNDTLTGGAGSDSIFGGQGVDLITGGAGRDILTGGLGSDTFVQAITDSGTTSTTSDVITDFLTGTDKLDLPTAGTSGNFRTVTASSAVSPETAEAATGLPPAGVIYTFVAGPTNGYLVIDTNSDGVAESIIVLSGKTAVTDMVFSDII